MKSSKTTFSATSELKDMLGKMAQAILDQRLTEIIEKVIYPFPIQKNLVENLENNNQQHQDFFLPNDNKRPKRCERELKKFSSKIYNTRRIKAQHFLTNISYTD